eukprot:Selendium_serpulae@DN5264_c0_g1_i1.p1
MSFRVGILGATGAVGQQFANLLKDHPWFKVTALCASERSAGKKYRDVVKWKVSAEIPADMADMDIGDCNVEKLKSMCDIVFSGLDAAVAGQIETQCAAAGIAVFSNAKNHRYDKDVPILIPTINSEHLDIVHTQDVYKQHGGFIVTNSNCAVTALCMAITPLHKKFEIEQMFITTLQACSGAGYPGIPSMDVLDNCVPYIEGEEVKVEEEPKKIMGHIDKSEIKDANTKISAMCHRVPVTNGHLISVSMLFKDKTASAEKVVEMLKNYKCAPEIAELPTCPKPAIIVRDEPDRPQHRLDRSAGGGMAVTVGRIRECNIFDVRLSCLAHNTVAGAAGGSILNAEYAVKRGMVKRR